MVKLDDKFVGAAQFLVAGWRVMMKYQISERHNYHLAPVMYPKLELFSI